MVKPDKMQGALKVIQCLIILVRKMAYEKADHDKIASLLDDVEHLPGLLLAEKDCTDEFRKYICGIVEQNGWSGLIPIFDEDKTT